MDDAELDVSNPEILLGPSMGEEQSSLMDSLLSAGFLNDCLHDTHAQHQHACSHLHTCNPPGPDQSHTHTCLHVHTKIVPAPTDDTSESTEQSSPKKHPLPPPTNGNDDNAVSKKSRKGNCEAVRKYRLKKKARAASLEEEVAQLREINQQLMKRLQGQAALEAEVARLRCLLVDMRGRIEGEIGAFPYQKPVRVGGGLVHDVAPTGVMGGTQFVNSCYFSCDEQVQCLHPGMQVRGDGEGNGQGFGACGIGSVQCMGSVDSGTEFLGCESGGNVMPAGCSSSANKIKGSQRTTEG